MNKIFQLSVFLLLFSKAYVFAENSPVPPKVKSKIGYLLVEKNVNISPNFKRFLILPHVELLELSQDIDSFHLVYTGNSSSFCCNIPKYAKNMVLLRDAKRENYISFRGPIEVKTIPFELKEGEELPIKEKNRDAYIVQVNRKGVLLPLIVPNNTHGVVFSTLSEFAKFAEEQKTKGLGYHKGDWIPVKQAEFLVNKETSELLHKQKTWKSFKQGASYGVVVLKNGAVLHGKLTGYNDYNILFESDGRDYFLSLDDVAPILFDTIIARGKLDKATTHLLKAKTVVRNDKGRAMYHAEQAVKQLQGVSIRADKERKQSETMLAEVSGLIEEIDSSLSKSGKAIYHNAVFPIDILNYHLKEGHVLLRKKFWLKKEQLCKPCHSSGNITCITCRGVGRLKEDCITCVKGRETCSLCEGEGRKSCDYCDGKGYIYIERKRSTVFAGFGSRMYGGGYYPQYNAGTVIYAKDKLMVIKPYPYYIPTYTGSYISIGNEDETVKKVCPKCNGTGTLMCPKTKKCITCKGVGYFINFCNACEGKKKKACRTCTGKGFKGSPQILPKQTTPIEEPKEGHGYFNTPVVIP